MLTFHYFADVKRTIYDSEYKRLLLVMKDAGVSVLWLFVYASGRYTAEKSEIIAAKAVLEEAGFEVNALFVPVGHPGNSLNPEEELDLALPEHWNYRVDSSGKKVYFCACVDENVIADNREAVAFCRDAGFRKLFFDDDLRQGIQGDVIEGCYCEGCLRKFAETVGCYYTREQIVEACKSDNELAKAWVEYNCSKITRFMVETAVGGITPGIMVMYNGGKKHGIDIEAIKEAVPSCMFRVGEFHFDDSVFEADIGHENELASMKNHLSLVGDIDRCFSETTVFPPRALSPKNLVEKAELAAGLGIRNIFLMSGTWVMTDDYWNELAENRARLEEIAASRRQN